jgi:hypothetical protein
MRIRRVVAGFHGGLAALHVYWATGAAWPAADQQSLSRAVLGRVVSFAPQIVLPLAALHLLIAWFVLRVDRSRLSRAAVGLVAVGVTGRAALGVAWAFTTETSTAFYWLNLFAYTPACVLLLLGDLRLVGARQWLT